jgi:hypothetical protein
MDEREEILETYHALLGATRRSERNPLEQPLSLARSDLPRLLAEDYVVLRKSDGVRHTLFLTTTKASGALAVLLDRRLELRRVPVAARKEFFEGTVLDCELVRTHAGERRLLAFDALAFKGRRVLQEPYGERSALVAECLLPEPASGCVEEGDLAARERALRRRVAKGLLVLGASKAELSIYAKPHTPLCRLEELLSSGCSHETDGLVFVALGRGSRPGTSTSTFKLKSQHTVDLEVSDGKLLCGRGGGPSTAMARLELDAALEGLAVDERFWESLSRLVDEEGRRPCPLILECALSPGRVLRPLRLRLDKSHPNTLDVVRRTSADFDEGLSPSEVLALLGLKA